MKEVGNNPFSLLRKISAFPTLYYFNYIAAHNNLKVTNYTTINTYFVVCDLLMLHRVATF